MSSQLDSDRLQLCGKGNLDDATWAFYEGSYPISADDSATGQKLAIKWPDGSISAGESINQALSQDNMFNILLVARGSANDRTRGPGAVVVTFTNEVSAVELGWSDGTATSVLGVACSATNHRFAVSSIPADESRINVRLVDHVGATIIDEAVALRDVLNSRRASHGDEDQRR